MIKFYLAGSMTGLKDKGLLWRRKAAKKLSALGFTIEMPADLTKTVKTFSKIIEADLNLILTCDAVIVNYTKESAGTCSELTWALMHKIPVLMVTKLKKLNPWVDACVKHKFKTFEDLFEAIAPSQVIIKISK